MELVKIEKMSSREIAELTGKNHADIMRDIRNLFEQVKAELGESSFALGSYLDANNQKRPQYLLTKKECLLLMSGYNPVLRLKIIDRWEKLEIQSKEPQTKLEWIKFALEQEEQKQLLENKVENLSTALDSLVEWTSIIKVCQFNKVKEGKFDWRKLKAKSKDLGYEIKKGESNRFDYQNLYHVNVFRACYPEYNYNFLNK